MDDFDGLLEVLYISTLSYGVSLDSLLLCPFWKLDIRLIFKLLHFSIQVLPVNSPNYPQSDRWDASARVFTYLTDPSLPEMLLPG